MNFLTPASVRSSSGPSLTGGASTSGGSAVVVVVIRFSGQGGPFCRRDGPRMLIGGSRPVQDCSWRRLAGLPIRARLDRPSQCVALVLLDHQRRHAGTPGQFLLG